MKSRSKNESRPSRLAAAASLLAILALLLVTVALSREFPRSEEAMLSGVGQSDADPRGRFGIPLHPEADRTSTPSDEEHYPVTIRRPNGPPRIELAGADPQGRVGSVACSTCHSIREPNLNNKTVADLDEFHQSMQFAHGKLTCYSCHNPTDSDSLRLADGSRVDYTDVMTLCAQCHGTQMNDYLHGSHGGMTGYWDLRRGGRTRNHCVDCHDPHLPQFPKMKPTFKPRDRFLNPTESADSHHALGGSHE